MLKRICSFSVLRPRVCLAFVYHFTPLLLKKKTKNSEEKRENSDEGRANVYGFHGSDNCDKEKGKSPSSNKDGILMTKLTTT